MKTAREIKESADKVEQRYVCNASAKLFHESTAQVKSLCGPVGSGKSLAALMEGVFLSMESDVPTRTIILRESWRQLRDSTLVTWQEWFSSCSKFHAGDHQISYTIPNYAGKVQTHEIHLRHCRRVEEASNFLSTEYAIIHFEEPVPAFAMESGVIGAGLPEGAFDVALMRQRQRGMHRLHLLLSFNPPSKFHWCWRKFFEPPPEQLAKLGFALFRQPAFENTAHLPPRYYERLIEQLGEDMARRFVYGEPVTMYAGVRVWPEFFEGVHFADDLKPNPNVPLCMGFDFGLTPAVVIGQQLPSGRLLIYREIQLFSAGIERMAEQLKSVLRDEFPQFDRWQCWGDPAGSAKSQTDERTCFEILREHGFGLQPGAIDIASRLESVRQMCGRLGSDGQPAILIDRYGCPMLMEGLLGGYRYQRYSSGEIAPNPLKNEYSHIADALQYLASGVMNVRTGQFKKETRPTHQRPVYDPLTPSTPKGPGARTWMSTV